WRKRPWLLVGWLWYVGMLVPVIGLVQFGAQAEADRYTYLPQIGLTLALVWTASELWRGFPRPIGAVAATCLLTILLASAWRQTRYWRDSETLWTHALACTSQNPVAHGNLGLALLRCGQVDKAVAHFQKALEIKPDYVDARINLGLALARRGQVDGAIGHYQ